MAVDFLICLAGRSEAETRDPATRCRLVSQTGCFLAPCLRRGGQSEAAHQFHSRLRQDLPDSSGCGPKNTTAR